MCVKTDFKNKTCLKFLKTSFFLQKNVAGLGPTCNLPHNDVTLLDIVPGSVVFWLQNAWKCSHSAALFAYIWDVFESFDSSSEQEQAEANSKSSWVVSNHKWLDMPLRTMFIFDDRQLSTVEATVRRILLAFRQKPLFQLLAFTSGKTTTNPND